jgi:RIO-like serine/threonine protein kinase
MQAPTREALRARPPLRFRAGRNATKADIFFWEEDGVRLVVKDYAPRAAWVRGILGRAMVRREVRAYQLLKDLPGVPRFAGQVDSLAFAVEFVEGRDLSHFRRGEIPDEFFVILQNLLESVHRAGVSQGDIHHRDIVVGLDLKPFLVDFSTAVFRQGSAGSLRQRLFHAACGSDRRAVLKLKHRHAPHSLTEAEHYELTHPPNWYRLGKYIRSFWKFGRRK